MKPHDPPHGATSPDDRGESAGAPPARRRRTIRQRLIWPGGLIFMVAALVTVDITMLMIASSDKSFAVVTVDGDPSEAWNARRRQERRNAELAWDADFRVDLPVGRPAEAVLDLRDEQGEPLTDAVVSLVAFHHARAAERLKAVLIADPDEPGVYRGSVRIAREGRWAFELDCTIGETRFTTEAERFILLPMAGGMDVDGAAADGVSG